MMRTLATVVAVTNGKITVSCQQQTSCGHCASRDSCSTGVVSKALPGRQHQLELKATEPVQVGQVVEIGLSEQSMLSSAILVYVVPLVFLIVGALLGQWWFVDLAGGGELAVVATALFSAVVGLGVAKRYARRMETNSAYQPQLIRVLGAPLAADMVTNAASEDSE